MDKVCAAKCGACGSTTCTSETCPAFVGDGSPQEETVRMLFAVTRANDDVRRETGDDRFGRPEGTHAILYLGWNADGTEHRFGVVNAIGRVIHETSDEDVDIASMLCSTEAIERWHEFWTSAK